MHSVNTQTHYDREMVSVEAARPEPLINDRVGAREVVELPAANQAAKDVRFQLAAAFIQSGRGSNATTAYRRAKDFYRSSGHSWTCSLG